MYLNTSIHIKNIILLIIMKPVIFRNIDISKIAFKKPEKVSEKITIYNVRYKGERLLIQTPKFIIPYIPTIYSHKNIQ